HNIAAIIAGVVPAFGGGSLAGLAGRGVPRSPQVTGAVFVSGGLGAEVHCYAASLGIVRPHGKIEYPRVHVFGYRELPAPADAGNIDVVFAGRLPSAEIGRLDLVAGIRIVDSSSQLAAECNGSVDAAQRKLDGRAGGCYQGHLRNSGQVTHLVDLD